MQGGVGVCVCVYRVIWRRNQRKTCPPSNVFTTDYISAGRSDEFRHRGRIGSNAIARVLICLAAVANCNWQPPGKQPSGSTIPLWQRGQSLRSRKCDDRRARCHRHITPRRQKLRNGFTAGDERWREYTTPAERTWAAKVCTIRPRDKLR